MLPTSSQHFPNGWDRLGKVEGPEAFVKTESPLSKNLKELMEREKLYLNEKLSGNEMAETLGISRHQLSEVLNNELETNFYNFILQPMHFPTLVRIPN